MTHHTEIPEQDDGCDRSDSRWGPQGGGVTAGSPACVPAAPRPLSPGLFTAPLSLWWRRPLPRNGCRREGRAAAGPTPPPRRARITWDTSGSGTSNATLSWTMNCRLLPASRTLPQLWPWMACACLTRSLGTQTRARGHPGGAGIKTHVPSATARGSGAASSCACMILPPRLSRRQPARSRRASLRGRGCGAPPTR